ncbi:tetratricopeptide repeat protein [Pirellulaceae bacterium]|nr:tetratricopeptide repeat protein [Pirellulaceae bacterium]
MNTNHLLLLLLTPLLLSGCRDRSQVNVSEIRPRETESDNLQTALAIVDGLDNADLSQATSACIYNFNQWIEKHDDDSQWVTPSLLSALPIHLAGTGLVNNVGAKRFFPPDVNYLQEMSWISQIARWIQANEVDHRKIWDDHIPASVQREDRAKLQKVLRMFDWTVRNVQLEPLLEYPEVPEGETRTAPELGMPGPGYSMAVRDILVFGKGDWWQRARVLALLARQVDVSVVLLGLPAEFGEAKQPWLTACLIGDQLYLLDVKDGLPVLTEDGAAIATLHGLRQNQKYAVTLLPASIEASGEEMLSGLVGLIEADVMSVSHRMAILEKYLTGDRQMKLTTMPNTLSRELRTKHAIEKSEIWVPTYEYYAFATALNARISEGDAGVIAFLKEKQDYQILEDMYQLKEGRFKSFRGLFDDFEIGVGQETQRGSKTLLMSSRLSQDKIVKVTTDRQVQEELGYVRPDEMSVTAWQENLRRTKLIFVKTKDMASYMIGMIHMEQGNYSDAIDWLERRTLQIGVDDTPPASLDPNQNPIAQNPSLDLLSGLVGQNSTPEVNRLEKSIYDTSARYNLARCYLALGDYQRAKELLEDDAFDAAQKRGNAKLLRVLK